MLNIESADLVLTGVLVVVAIIRLVLRAFELGRKK